ncbi:trimethylamine methyltransferase family protein, partial [Chloroflexota bacterium]
DVELLREDKKMLKGFTRKFKPLEILSKEEVETIHRGTLDVLETTGVRIEHNRALELYADHGCKVDFDKKRVRIPGYLVEDCLRKCPSSFTLRARDPKNDLRIGGNNLYFSQSVGMSYVDLDTWETRPATLKEHGEAIRVVDALDTVYRFLGYEFYMDMEGIPPCMVMLEGLASGIRNSAKTQCMGYALDCDIFAIKMAKAVGMDLMFEPCLSPPLTIYEDCCEAIFRSAEAGFPMSMTSGASMGASGPATIAGSTITNNAEILAGLVLAQLIRPGIGVSATDFVFPMDMKSGHPAFGAVGCSLHNIVFEQIWRRYGIPTTSASPFASSSKKIDFQLAYEKSLMSLVAALAGASCIFLHGAAYGELTYHPALAVLEDDVAGWIGRFIEGVEVTDETLAINLIEQVGPIPGNFLTTEHTRKWWKKEQFIPKVADREPYPEWIKKGKKDALALARERVEEILATHKPKPLTPEQDKVIGEILEEARSFYRQKGLM